MLIAIILALIFVPLLFIMGIKTGIEQADNKWIKVMKESSSETQNTISKLQAKLKAKNDEIAELKETQKAQKQDIKHLSEEGESLRIENKNLSSKVMQLSNEKCVHNDGIYVDEDGKHHCPIVYAHGHPPPKAFL